MSGRRTAQGLGLVALAGVAALTLIPGQWFWSAVGGARCLACGNLRAVEAVHNLVLFIPVGMALATRFSGWRRPALIACLVSVGVELLQVGIPTRDPSLEDVFMNSAGGALGAGIVFSRKAWLVPTVRLARRLSLGAAVVLVAIVGATGLLARPALTPTTALFSQWAPPRPNFDPFHGQILNVEVGDIPAPHGLFQDQSAIRAAWAKRPVNLHIEAVVPPHEGLRPVLLSRLMGKDGEAVLVAQRRDGYIVRVGLRASDLGFRTLTVSVGAPPDGPGPVRLDVMIDRDHVEVRAAGSRGESATRVSLNAGLGWVFLLPLEIPVGRWVHAASAVWLMLWALPIGFFLPAGFRQLPRERPGGRTLAVTLPVLMVAAGVGGLPLIATIGASPWSAWLATLAGGAAGWQLGLRLRVAQDPDEWHSARDQPFP